MFNMKSITVGDVTFNHGDYVVATLAGTLSRGYEDCEGYDPLSEVWEYECFDGEDDNGDECSLVKVVGRISINHDGKAYICQNFCDGCNGVTDRFGFRHSWTFSVNSDGTMSSDTKHLELLDRSNEHRVDVHDDRDDDDPMPENWEPTEIDIITID
jgi:hypothetical protein